MGRESRRVCACMCGWVCVCVRERERLCVCEFFACMYVHTCALKGFTVPSQTSSIVQSQSSSSFTSQSKKKNQFLASGESVIDVC